jgi:predicted small integral membrane protein
MTINRYPNPRRTPRRGFLLIEVVGGLMLLMAVLAMTVQLLAWSGATRREARHRQWALHEAQNVLDLLTALPTESLTTESLAARKLGARAETALPGGVLKVTTEAEDGEFPSLRVMVTVTWRGRSGEPVSPLRLVAWIPRTAEVSP